MPQLPNLMREKYARARARGVNQTNSALEAGYSQRSAYARGSELERLEDVQARVKELQEQAEKAVIQAVAVDKQWVLQQLVLNAQDAREAKDRSAANRALELVGKELGMFVDRKMDVKSPLDALNAQQLKALTDLLDRLGEGTDADPVAPMDLGSAEPANERPA